MHLMAEKPAAPGVPKLSPFRLASQNETLNPKIALKRYLCELIGSAVTLNYVELALTKKKLLLI
jgi:hypothetical protein